MQAQQGVFDELALDGTLEAYAQQSAFEELAQEHAQGLEPTLQQALGLEPTLDFGQGLEPALEEALGWSEQPAGLSELRTAAGLTGDQLTGLKTDWFWLGPGHSGGPWGDGSWPRATK